MAKWRIPASAKWLGLLFISAVVAFSNCAPRAIVPQARIVQSGTFPSDRPIRFHRETLSLKLGRDGAYVGPLYVKLSEARKGGIIVKVMSSDFSIGVKKKGREFKFNEVSLLLKAASDGENSAVHIFAFSNGKWVLMQFKYSGKGEHGVHLVEVAAYTFAR